ncbi:NAD-dependent epimerase/dehydratase family protein [Aliivibrio fischeri]|uniref:NAD-dependent epimerase/dehydratase family protein n=1 Tax=Aliivibrio fischeri TaxID=668 RepID=UPI0007C46D8D|nr:NAD-dependent epimerase/dehydratase family protein [Aliivibrio fischeri]MBP3139534.1 nucleoside-diphosphate sugar epimerase [Aliivibrio fischeri]MBP3155124.1 nucleoside-diphosphate sugar epimerase [Aliivibrio fischeri]MCE7573296.1 nucleoside-diphosphate sugar epimerase [Aliivibrio fischeri]
MFDSASIIIAGSTGLIGHHLLNFSLKNESVNRVYSLSRRSLDETSSKLVQMVSDDLSIDKNQLEEQTPDIGFITLGTTIKKAGSKAALKAIDTDLVVSVAQSMREVGVRHIYVVSCIGASSSAFSHYLKCKGEMEDRITLLGFSSTTFMQPGPLSGDRSETRKDEVLLQGVMGIINPLMKGCLLNYKPIEGEVVAECMLDLALQNDNAVGVHRYRSKATFEMKS